MALHHAVFQPRLFYCRLPRFVCCRDLHALKSQMHYYSLSAHMVVCILSECSLNRSIDAGTLIVPIYIGTHKRYKTAESMRCIDILLLIFNFNCRILCSGGLDWVSLTANVYILYLELTPAIQMCISIKWVTTEQILLVSTALHERLLMKYFASGQSMGPAIAPAPAGNTSMPPGDTSPEIAAKIASLNLAPSAPASSPRVDSTLTSPEGMKPYRRDS